MARGESIGDWKTAYENEKDAHAKTMEWAKTQIDEVQAQAIELAERNQEEAIRDRASSRGKTGHRNSEAAGSAASGGGKKELRGRSNYEGAITRSGSARAGKHDSPHHRNGSQTLQVQSRRGKEPGCQRNR